MRWDVTGSSRISIVVPCASKFSRFLKYLVVYSGLLEFDSRTHASVASSDDDDLRSLTTYKRLEAVQVYHIHHQTVADDPKYHRMVRSSPEHE